MKEYVLTCLFETLDAPFYMKDIKFDPRGVCPRGAWWTSQIPIILYIYPHTQLFLGFPIRPLNSYRSPLLSQARALAEGYRFYLLFQLLQLYLLHRNAKKKTDFQDIQSKA